MDKTARMTRRKRHIRKTLSGTAERPRLCIYRGSKTLNAQVVDDLSGKTLCSLSTLSAKISEKVAGSSKSNVKSASALGEEIGKMAVAKGVSTIVFDRSGYRYHGVIKAFAEAARKSGLKF
jgi:large subunit ribosomal protein L18